LHPFGIDDAARQVGAPLEGKTFAFLGRCHFIRARVIVHPEMGGKHASGWE
jgi:hypothetical protein